MKKPRPRVFIHGRWVYCDKVADAIDAQEQLERIGALRMAAAPEMDPAERAALERVNAGALALRDADVEALLGTERALFDEWRAAPPSYREALKAVVTDRLHH